MLDHLLPAGTKSKHARKVSAPKVETKAVKKAVIASVPAPVVIQKQKIEVTETVISNKPSIASRALAIVADEVGLEASDLVPTATFADFGVDSLLSLNIASRFREELDLEVESTLFSDYPTVKELLGFLPGGKGTPQSTAASTATNTPSLENTSAATSTTDETECSTVADVPAGDESNVLATIKLTIAEEVGIPLEELTGTLAFSDVGLDSLLSLTVLGKLREVLDMELPGSIFQDNGTLDEVEAALGLKPKSVAAVPSTQVSATDSVTIKIDSPVTHTQVSATQFLSIKTVSHPPATSILLQGNAKTATKKFFLFPDGSGSATSYAPLPKISSDIVVYGLNCPYMRNPSAMKCSLEDLTPSYLSEIRRRQPHGPYYFGGWSAGGIAAFDAAQALDRDGETVSKLVLIDTPFPIGLEKLPPRLYDFFNTIGLFGSGEKAPPSWLLPHFLAFIDALDRYRVQPYGNAKNAPETHILWARDGVCKRESDPRPVMREDDPREMKWLLNNRTETDFSGEGWEGLLGRGKVRTSVMDDANHFTMMEGRKVVELAEFVASALA